MKMGVCGTGRIGVCLTALMVGNNVETTVIARSQESADRCVGAVDQEFKFLAEKGLVTAAQKTAVMKLLTVTTDYRALQGSELIFEAVAEDPDTKAAVYAAIEDAVDDDTIIASSTSALTPDELCKTMRRPERFLVAHPFQPAHLQPLVELAGNKQTTPVAMERAKELLEGPLKRQVVVLKQAVPGFIVNRIAQSMFRECIHLVQEGIAEPADLDKAIRYAVGMRYASIGLLEYFDDVGFQLEKNIAQSVYPSLCRTQDVQPLVEEGLQTGKTGLKAGMGLYRWEKRDIADYQQRKTEPFLAIFNWSLPEA